MAPNVKIKEACNAVKLIGISENRARSVLKKLLKVYDDDWTFIEAEGFKLLIDTIIDEDAEANEKKKRKIEEKKESKGVATSRGKRKAPKQSQALVIYKEDDEPEEDETVKKRLRRKPTKRYDNNSPISKNVKKEELKVLKVTQLDAEEEEEDEDCAPLRRSRRKPARLRDDDDENNLAVSLLGSSMTNKAREEDHKEEEADMNELPPLKRYLRRRVEKHSAMIRENSSAPVLETEKSNILVKEREEETENVLSSASNESSESSALMIINNDSFTDNHKAAIRENTSAPVLESEKSNILVKERDEETENVPSSSANESSESSALMIINNDSFTDNHKAAIRESSSALVLETEKSNILVEKRDEETEDDTTTAAIVNVPSSAVEESTRQNFAAAELELASSTSGEAKISLSFVPAVGEETTDLCLPSMDDLRRAMEEKCLQKYKIVHPSFSFLGLMKDMCSCYIDLAKNPISQTLKTVTVSEASDENGSMGLVVVPECEISADGWRAISNIKDITVGEENVKIPWVNEISEEVPSRFRYIPQSVVFQDAEVKFFSILSFSDEQCCFSSCIHGDCLDSPSSSCNCTVAYTVDGVLKDDFLEERISEALDERKQVLRYCKECPLEKAKKDETLEPCKGHIKRKAMKECCIKCGCTKSCGNRTVQRGIHNKLEAFYTPNGKGWGLRTVEKLRKGSFVCEYIGEILTISELYERRSKGEVTSPVILDANWGSSEECVEDNKALCLDGTRYGNISRFLNHRCLDANLIEIPVHIETPDQYYYHLAFFTTRDIEAMEELTWDYGVDFEDDDCLMKRFECLCGSRHCRNIKRSKKAKKIMNKA